MRARNRRVVLATRPAGVVQEADMRVEEVDAVAPGEGQVLVETAVLAVDAFVRTMLDERRGTHGSVAIGGQVPAHGVGVVRAVGGGVEHLRVGDRVVGMLGAQTLATADAAALQPAGGDAPAAAHLGLLGTSTGVTAWVGVHCVALPPRAGDVAVVSAAAGGVGCVAAQLCRAAGARTIGGAGGARKCAFLRDELRLAGAVDRTGDIGAQLDALAPDGIDFFFDCAGGELLDEVLARLRPGARVIICGAASQYSGNRSATGGVRGPSNYLKLASMSASMVGFNVAHYAARFAEARAGLLRLAAEGRVVLREHWVGGGVAAFPSALRMMFTGGHVGKLLVRVGDGRGARL